MKKMRMKWVILSLAALLFGCEKKETAPTVDVVKATAIADEFCVGNFDSWKVVSSACADERASGKVGASCETLGSVDLIIDQRRRASVFKACQAPEVRFGANAKNK